MLNKAYIDLVALKNNALAVKSKLEKGVKFCAVVKADAYGHGGCECAKTLYPIVDCFAVALVEEAVALRLSGVDKDILVLIPPFSPDIDVSVHYGLTLTVSNAMQIAQISRCAKRQNKTVKVHIKVNTGMNRQGADGADEIIKIARAVMDSNNVVIDGIYSHFARPENEKARNDALYKFLLANKALKGYNRKVTSHISASGGFLAGVQADMVRIGILLYGYKPYPSELIDVKPVMRVVAPIVCTRSIGRGDGALYGDFRADSDEQYALVRYGYADGLFRHTVDGQLNNRCMDLTAVKGDFGGINYVEILGSADEIAFCNDTISYEILCRAACRAEKIYIR